jgi:glucose/arabinose dehydrogenase/plastocyanin
MRLRYIVLLLVTLLLLAACAGDEDVQPTEPAEPTEAATEEIAPTIPATEEATAEPTEAATEEPTATAAPTEEPTAEATATEEAPAETAEGEEEEHLETLGVQLIAEGLTGPTHLGVAPGDPEGRLFVTDQIGLVYIVTEEGGVVGTFLDIQDRLVALDAEYDERGLLGMAFHPDYANNGRFFVYYSAPDSQTGVTIDDTFTYVNRLSEFAVMADDPNLADPASERVLLEIPKPQNNHNGGDISFGPDGMLYVPLGDGGSGDDVDVGHVEDWYADNAGGNGQDVSQNLLGSILRIDVDNGDPYAIPEDNPVLGDNEAADEQWAFGFRNPWRATWDMETGEYYVSDAGQDQWEEVSLVEAGGNYAWNVWEAAHCFDAEAPEVSPEECPVEDAWGNELQMPIIEFPNQLQSLGGYGLTVVGGYVYRGSAIPELEGSYLLGAWTTGEERTPPLGGVLVAERPDEGAATGEDQPAALWPLRELHLQASTGEWSDYIYSFGQDADGEMYILTSQSLGPAGATGRVWKIVPAEEMAEEAPEEAAAPTPTPSGEGEAVYVSAENFYFEMPRELAAGTYTFIITNPTDGTEHNFEIEGNGEEWVLEAPVAPGESATLTVELAPGEYEVYCPVSDHQHIGMALTLTVTE